MAIVGADGHLRYQLSPYELSLFEIGLLNKVFDEIDKQFGWIISTHIPTPRGSHVLASPVSWLKPRYQGNLAYLAPPGLPGFSEANAEKYIPIAALSARPRGHLLFASLGLWVSGSHDPAEIACNLMMLIADILVGNDERD